MKILEAIDHIAQVVMAASIIGILISAIEQRRYRQLEERKMELDPRIPTEDE